MPCVPEMLPFHWRRLPHLQQPKRGLELDWTPLSMPGPRSPVGTTGPLLSCDQSVDNGICFCLPSWKTPMALPLFTGLEAHGVPSLSCVQTICSPGL